MQVPSPAAVKKIYITSQLFHVCQTHALSSEKEEVMGLLFGNIKENSADDFEVYVWDASMLTRSDKRSDRVEISPEQLALASQLAEKQSKDDNYPTRIVGWYHSHPHITPWPSHIDLNYQGNYQFYLEKAFVGLIFSTFNFSKDSKKGELSLHGFQTQKSPDNGPLQKISIPVEILSLDQSQNFPSHENDRIIGLQEILLDEEKSQFLETITSSQTSKTESNLSALKKIHHSSILQSRIIQLVEKNCIPLKLLVETQIAKQKQILQVLEEERSKLEQKVEFIKQKHIQQQSASNSNQKLQISNEMDLEME